MATSSHDERPDGAAGSLHSHLALGLHAFAQPLAILRAKLYIESISRLDARELHQLAIDSAGQVERLCTLFNYLQEIVLAETCETKLAEISVSEVLEHVVDGVELWFRDTGLILESAPVDRALLVLADKAKLSQAISSLALLTHGLSKPGETITMSTIPGPDRTQISIVNTDADVSNLSAEARLALALVETNIRKQHGTFTYSTQPLELCVYVPNAPITT